MNIFTIIKFQQLSAQSIHCWTRKWTETTIAWHLHQQFINSGDRLHLKTENKTSSNSAHSSVHVSVVHSKTRMNVESIIVIVTQLLVSRASWRRVKSWRLSRFVQLAFRRPGRENWRINGQWMLLKIRMVESLFRCDPLGRIVCQKPVAIQLKQVNYLQRSKELKSFHLLL